MFRCVCTCVADLTLLSSPVPPRSGMPPGCSASAGLHSSSQRGEGDQISARRSSGGRWRQQVTPGWSQRLPAPLFTSFRKTQSSKAEPRAAAVWTYNWYPMLYSQWWPMWGLGTTQGPGGGSRWSVGKKRNTLCHCFEFNTMTECLEIVIVTREFTCLLSYLQGRH